MPHRRRASAAQNYHYLRTIDPDFWPAVRHNVIWLVEFTVIATPLGMFLAVLLDRGIRGSRIYQSIFFLPVMLSLALIGIIWELMYGAQYGLINGVLGKTNPNVAINWLGNPNLNLWAVLVEATWRQAGYVMILYLAGLKAFDPALREAAMLDGANAWQLFWRVTFPALRPINNVIFVVTIIESLRAFDLVYVTNGGTNGLQLLSAMITQNITGPANRIGYGSALGVVLLVIALVPIIYFLVQQFRKDELMTATVVAKELQGEKIAPASRPRPGRRGLAGSVFVFVLAVLWLIPLLWTIYTSFRTEADTNVHGYLSWSHSFTFTNYSDAWTQGDILQHFENSLLITVPAVLITLFLAAGVAFVVSRFSNKLNLALLLLFTAGNLLPQQILLAPLFKIYTSVHVPNWLSDSGTLYDSISGIVLINIAFQTGFCVFVLSNFMRTLPVEMTEAALIDGASVWTQFWRITLPLCRPALAALATLLTTWIYNDFFWALTLMSTGSKFPVTSAIKDLQGEFAQNANLLSAGSLIIAIPTLVVYFVLQRQFIAGLTLGSTKG